MRTRTQIGVLIAALMIALPATTGCGSLNHPATATLSFEGQAAVRGRQLIAAVDSAATGVDILIDGQTLPRAEGVKVLQVLRVIGVESQRLADTLMVIDQAKVGAAEHTSNKLKAAEIVKGIQAALLRGIVPVGTEESRGKVAALLGIVARALADISIIIPSDPDPAVHPITDSGNWHWQLLQTRMAA